MPDLLRPFPDSAVTDWDRAPLGELTCYLAQSQHARLRDSLRAAGRTVEHLANRHVAGRDDSILPLRRVILRLADDVDDHMRREESVLFPAIGSMEQAAEAGQAPSPPAFGSFRNPIRMIEQEHDATLTLIGRIRALTQDYTMHDPACEMVRVLCQVLQSLETDLLEHIELERHVLFPRALALETRLAG